MRAARGWIGVVVVGLLGCRGAAAQSATAELVNAQGVPVGRATFTESGAGVTITLTAHDLPAGWHAFHIHGVGSCEPPAFTSAGPHFNPTAKQHGAKNPAGKHAGDLPNLSIGADGTGAITVVEPGVTLGEGAHSLFHPGGTALVVHASVDDEVTDPAGNAGPRIACGVITRSP